MNSKYKFTISNLIEIISKFNINDLVIDELQSFNGDIHEKFLKYQGNKNSKELGQFFTPREIIKAILDNCGFKNLIENLEGNNLSIYDPCLGTGGLLCYTYNSCKTKIKPDNIYGCEIENDTIKLGIVSLMISTNNCNKNIKLCNSLIENPYLFEDKKFDIIFSNPPFGTKTNYKELEKDFNKFKDNYYKTSSLNFKDIYKISANTGINLFIQNIIYLLKIGGIACIILPDGELMIGKSSINIRKFILDNCRILKIITINSGAFTNTNIKTKALIIQKGNYDNYNQEVEFVEINSNCINSLGLEKLNSTYQFNISKKEEIINYNKDIEIKTLGEICEFCTKSQKLASYGKKEGIYPFITSSQEITKYCDEPDYKDDNYIIIGTGGNPNIHYQQNLSCSGDCIVLKSTKYIYYYLSNNINILEEGFKGATIKHISKEYIKNIKIPFPSLEQQNEIVEYLDIINKNTKSSNDKIEEIKKLNEEYLKINVKYNKNIEIKTLDEVCNMSIKGNTNSKEISNTGEYHFYKASVTNPSGTHNTYCFDDNEYILFIKSGGNANNPLSLTHGIGKVYYVNGKSCGNTEVIMIKGNSNINLKYLYYYLNINQLNIQKLAKYSTNLGHINMTEFKLMKIKIPSLEKQKEIVDYLDYNNEIIKNLEKEIEFNKKQAEDFFKQIL
jgi:type I restriction enzyme S subunit